MSTISVNTLTKPSEFREWMFRIAEKEAERVARRLAEMAEVSIKMWIMNTSKSPTGALANAFFKEQTGKTSWGIGKISDLNETVPYWRHVNFGSEAINADWQHKLPKGHWENGRWIEGDGPDEYFGIPQTPIQAHNYIEKTISDLNVAIQKVISGR